MSAVRAWLAAVHGLRSCSALPAMMLGIMSAVCGWRQLRCSADNDALQVMTIGLMSAARGWNPTWDQGSVVACCCLSKDRLVGHSLQRNWACWLRLAGGGPRLLAMRLSSQVAQLPAGQQCGSAPSDRRRKQRGCSRCGATLPDGNVTCAPI